jgi:Domain of unknown function (DUF1961)
MKLDLGEELYANPLAAPDDAADFRTEGPATVSFPNGRLRLSHAMDPSLGQRANFVYWCPAVVPADVAIRWEFWPVQEPGLCILFFAATGAGGQDLFDPGLATRTGEYQQYHSGDIDAFHVSYFRRMRPGGRALHTCNLRKSRGFHLVAQGANPIPGADDWQPPYHITVTKWQMRVSLLINDLLIFTWRDDGKRYGPPLLGGRLGFRHQGGLVAEYANLRVHTLEGEPVVDDT